MIIHISGAPGSGKTTLGRTIAQSNTKLLIKDLDDLFEGYIQNNKFSSNGYQSYIDKFITENKDQDIILVGLNGDKGKTDTLYHIPADFRFYLKIPINTHVERLFTREIDGWLKWMTYRDKNVLYRQLTKDENKVINGLTSSLDRNLRISEMKKEIKRIDDRYRKEKYKFMSPEELKKLLCN
jgi:adenylate kinase family enzyme